VKRERKDNDGIGDAIFVWLVLNAAAIVSIVAMFAAGGRL
jgi:hypothetical protein